MRVEQLAVFLENKANRLAEITQILAESGINIRALSLADTGDFGILRLLVNDTGKARQVLQENNFAVGISHVCVIATPDKPGGLATALQVIKAAALNVECMQAFSQRSGDTGLVIFRFDELDRAINALQKAGIRVLTSEEINAI